MGNIIKSWKIKDGWKTSKKTMETYPSTLHVGVWAGMIKRDVGEHLKFNEITLLAELYGKPIEPEILDGLYIELGERGWEITKAKAKDAFIKVARSNSYNPIKKYLLEIENDQNILPVNIDKVATDFLKTDSPLADQMMAACLIGAVARALDHGCQMDSLTCLKGRQGIKKSTFWRTLGGEYFSDTQQKDIKDLRLCMNTCWIYEWAELEIWTTKNQQGTLKALITQRVDDFRPPYGSGMGRYPRKSILVGSVNEDSFLRDRTGSRRYWIIEVDQMIDIDLVIKERDNIWKAAINAYRKGREARLSDHAEQQSLLNNQIYENEDPFLEPIQRKVESWNKGHKFSTRDVLIDSELRDGNRITPADMNTAARILKSLGCVRDNHQTRNPITGERPRLWTLPQADSPN